MRNSKISNSDDRDLIKREYFYWLCSIVNIKDLDMELAGYLHSKYFYSILPNDDNRAAESKDLRSEFIDINDIKNDHFLDGDCSMFEMLVALSKRMDYIIGDNHTNTISECYRRLIDNAKFNILDKNDRLNYDRNIRNNDNIIKDILERRYKNDGNGGLFPLRNPPNNQRDTEIWYQMMYFLEENYQI